MDEETVANFCAVTNSEPRHAERYLAFSGGDLDTAVTMFFETGGLMPDDTQPNTGTGSAGSTTLDAPRLSDPEDDEAMARRLAQEWGGQAAEVRAPIAPTRQVLQDSMNETFDPFSMPQDFTNRFGSLASASSRNGSRPQSRGVFNQAAPSVWDGADEDAILREATGGASEQSSKSSRLVRPRALEGKTLLNGIADLHYRLDCSNHPSTSCPT